MQEVHRSCSMHYALTLEASEEVAKPSLGDVSTVRPREEEGGKRAPEPRSRAASSLSLGPLSLALGEAPGCRRAWHARCGRAARAHAQLTRQESEDPCSAAGVPQGGTAVQGGAEGDVAPPASSAVSGDDEDAALDEELFVGRDPSIADMARVHDVFLDYLAFLCTSATPHLMVHRFDSMLSEPERALKRALDGFVAQLAHEAPEAMTAPEWADVERMLLGLGGRATLAQARMKQRARQRDERRSGK